MKSISIPVMKPKLPSLDLVANFIKEMDEYQIYSNRGPMLIQAEEKMAKFLNVNPANLLFCSSATQGLSALAAISDVRGYFVPDYSFLASPLSVLNANKAMEICDVDEEFRIDLSKRSNAMDFGLLDVLPFGDNSLLSKDYLLFEDVIVDAAASLVNLANKLNNIPENISIVFSLHATKVMGIGEGGLVYCSNVKKLDKLRKYINFGFDENRSPETLGTNGKLGEISACYILANLLHWPKEKCEWEKVDNLIFAVQNRLGIPDITIKSRGINPYWIVDANNLEKRNALVSELTESGIGSRVWWQSFHKIDYLQPYINKNGYDKSSRFHESHLGLPKFKGMEENQVNQIFQILSRFFKI